MSEKTNKHNIFKDNVFTQLKANLSQKNSLDDDNEALYKSLTHGPGGGRDYRKPKDTKGTLKRILGYAMHNKLLLLFVICMLLVSTFSSLYASYFLKPIVDDFIIPFVTADVKDYSLLANRLLLLAGIYIVGVIATYLQSRIMARVAQNAVNHIRQDLFSKLQDLPISYYDAHTHGELMSRFTNDAGNVQMLLEEGLLQFISSIISFVGTVVLMIRLSWKLFIITFILIGVSFLIAGRISGASKILFKKQQAALGQLNGYIEELVDGIKVVKAFNYEERAKARFNELDGQYRDNAMLANFLGQTVMPILGSLMNICYAITAVIGGLFVLSSNFSIGSLGVYLNYTKQVSQPIGMVSNQVVNLMSAIAGAERIFNVMDTPPEIDEGNVTLVTVNRNQDGTFVQTQHGERTGLWAWKIPEKDGSFTFKEVRGDVRLFDVCFSYVPDKPVLKNVSVYAKPGQKIAFVGSTGAGKTTITNLINRFYEIDSGTITFDGIDIKDIKKSSLRRSMGMVLQDTNLFTGTVMDNIRYGKLDATDEECIAAAKSANAHGFISRLPEGYNTEITNNGENLSQGQRQLLGISRTAVANHPVLVMDEATSSIDTRTEKLIERGMDALMNNRTVFVIAHRLSTVRDAKAIAVIEHGEIIERGSHTELLAQKGRYYLLYTGQHELD